MSKEDVKKDKKIIEYRQVEKKYKNHPDRNRILKEARRRIFAKDILQPVDPQFKHQYKNAAIAREASSHLIQKEEAKKKAELDKAYRRKGFRRSRTLEQKVLVDLHKDHPKMVTEEEIIKWNT